MGCGGALQGIFSLIIANNDRSRVTKELDIPSAAMQSLTELRYLRVNANSPIIFEKGQEGLQVLEKLVLLDCQSDGTLESLAPAIAGSNLVILSAGGLRGPEPTCIGSFAKLRVLTLSVCSSLESLPDEYGDLSQLEDLCLEMCDKLQTLPDSFSKLSALNKLTLRNCPELKALPDSFGNLYNLRFLKIYHCGLQALPDSFGNLSALKKLILYGCDLQGLPNSFGELSALKTLNIYYCSDLLTLLIHLEIFVL
jgi:Leucine-rich repeat (LRR) protein